MKGKLKGAQTGHSLLKRKSEALTKYEGCPDGRLDTNILQAVSRFEFQ
jgi:hypothetical protein